MKRFAMAAIGFAVMIGIMAFSTDAQAGSKDEAKAMVKKVEAYLNANGKDKTIAEVQKNNGQFENGEVYVYLINNDATVLLAHPKLPTWVGKNFSMIKDADGKYFIKDALEQLKTKNDCWIVYKWNNPETKKIGVKHSYFVKTKEMIITSGVWE